MSHTAAKEERFKREHSRAQVVPSEISGMITVENGQKNVQIPFLVWDVSPTGIGLLSIEEIPYNREVTLTIGQPYIMVIKAKVAWCVEQGKDGFRCGLRVLSNEAKLQALYFEFCKIREENQRSHDFNDQMPS